MIILIAGASHTGKTKLAQTLLERYRYPSLSVDHLKMGLIRSRQTTLTPENDEQLTPYLWNITAEIIKTTIENKQNLIIEGCYIPFNWQDSFTAEYLNQIEFYCLIMSRRYIETHESAIRIHANDIEQRLSDNIDAAFLTEMIEENAYNLDQCKSRNLPYCLIDDTYSVGELQIAPFSKQNTMSKNLDSNTTQTINKNEAYKDALKAAQLFHETIHAVNITDYLPEQVEAWSPAREPLHSCHLQDIVHKLSNQYAIAAKECGIMIGFGSLDENHDVDMLYVHKDRQHQGIASKLLQALEGKARAQGKTEIITFASITAQPFFKAHGYQTVRENIAERNGVLLKNYLMKKQL